MCVVCAYGMCDVYEQCVCVCVWCECGMCLLEGFVWCEWGVCARTFLQAGLTSGPAGHPLKYLAQGFTQSRYLIDLFGYIELNV